MQLFGCWARTGTDYWYWILQVVVLVLQRSTLLSILGRMRRASDEVVARLC